MVVKLPRFPFDKFPSADRPLGSQMKATGEVMAIDRTFGAALNKALRGLEQAGAGFLAEDPAWEPTLDYLAGPLSRFGERSQGASREELHGEVLVGDEGLIGASEPTRSAPPGPSSWSGSWLLPTPGCGDCWRSSAGACRRPSSSR